MSKDNLKNDNKSLRGLMLGVSIVNLVLQIIMTLLAVMLVGSFIMIGYEEVADINEADVTQYMAVLGVAALVICFFVMVYPSISVLRSFVKNNPSRLKGVTMAYILLVGMIIPIILIFMVGTGINIGTISMLLSACVFMVMNIMVLKEIFAINSTTEQRGKFLTSVTILAAVNFILLLVFNITMFGYSGIRELLAYVVYMLVWNFLYVLTIYWIVKPDIFNAEHINVSGKR